MKRYLYTTGLIAIILLSSCLLDADAYGGWGRILVVRVHGTVLVSKSGNGPWEASHKWMELPIGARVKTLSGASIDLLLDSGAIVRMKENSEMLIRNMLDRLEKALSKARPGACKKGSCSSGTLIQLIKGKAFFYVSPYFSGLPLLVDTPIGTAGVTGTRFAVDLSVAGMLYIAVLRGHVIAWQKGLPEKSVVIGPDFIVRIEPKRAQLLPRPMDKKEHKKYEECLKLHLGLGLHQSLSETSSRYRGVFSRGYSPDVMTDIEPLRIYRYGNSNEKTQIINEQVLHHEDHGSFTSETEAVGLETHKHEGSNKVSDHHDVSGHRIVSDHHEGSDHHPTSDHRMSDQKMNDHHMIDHHTNRSHSVIDQHHLTDRSTTAHEAPSMHHSISGSKTGTIHSEPVHTSSPSPHDVIRERPSRAGSHR